MLQICEASELAESSANFHSWLKEIIWYSSLQGLKIYWIATKSLQKVKEPSRRQLGCICHWNFPLCDRVSNETKENKMLK